MRRAVLLLLAIAALSGCETGRQARSSPLPPYSYVCAIGRDVGRWRMQLARIVGVHPDAETWDMVEWRWLPAGAGVRPGMEYRKRPGGWELWQFYFHFATAAQPLGRVRMEIRRARPEGIDGRTLLAGSEDFYEPSTPYGGLRTRQGNFDLGVLQALIRNGERLAVVLVARNGTVRDRVPFDPAWLTPPMEAVEAARPELDAMAADYRGRCAPEQPIIIA